MITAGRITPSTLLRKLGACSKKNPLYQAFRERGCALQTEFLLIYLASAELRSLIQAATNKSEAYNGFVRWVAFDGDGTIATNDREEPRKIINYDHLVANCIILLNVFCSGASLAHVPVAEPAFRGGIAADVEILEVAGALDIVGPFEIHAEVGIAIAKTKRRAWNGEVEIVAG